MNEILMIVSIVAVVLALAFLVYLIISENREKRYKTILKSKNRNKNKNENENEEFGNFKEVDINGVRSSILLGNNLLDTEEDYEKYRKEIMELKLPKGDK